MKYIRGFGNFWYGFFIGDAWELAAGVVLTLLIAALLVSALLGIAWLIMPIGILLTLGGSVLWYGRQHLDTP